MRCEKGFRETAKAEGSQLSLLNAPFLMNIYCACRSKRLFLQGNASSPNTAQQTGTEISLNRCCLDRVYQGYVAFAYFPTLMWKDVISVPTRPGIPLQCALKRSTFLLPFESFYDTSIISNTW